MNIMRKKDKRAFVRLRAYHLAKYRISSSGAKEQVPVMANLKDISAGGARLVAEEYLSPSTLLELNINFPIFNEPLICLAKVMWIKQFRRSKRYEVGVQFQDLDGATRKAIDAGIKFVQRKMNAF